VRLPWRQPGPVVSRLANSQREIGRKGIAISWGARAVIVERRRFTRHARAKRMSHDQVARMRHQVGESRYGDELAIRKEIAPCRPAVVADTETERLLEELDIGSPMRLCQTGGLFVFKSWREKDSLAIALGHDCHQPRPQAACLPLGLDVVPRDRR